MPQTILIYANCVNNTAKGDFAFAGAIAKDLVREIEKQGLNLAVVLTSTVYGIPRFESLYGVAINNLVSVEEIEVGLCALEDFDSVENEVVAFIEANRCKYAIDAILKRVISPQAKLLFIGAANQPAWDDAESINQRIEYIQKKSQFYLNYEKDDFLVNSSGLDTNRLGLPFITPAKDLPPTSMLLPTVDYGFMYAAAIEPRDYQIVAQYIKLTGMAQYVLVGDFNLTSVYPAYYNDKSFNLPGTQSMPFVNLHSSLPYNAMRQVVANSANKLVLSTGTMSAMEAMLDGKLTFYQDLQPNEEFMATYLLAVKSICTNESSLKGNMPQLIIDLSSYLFASKPLSSFLMQKTHKLLSQSDVTAKLIETNQKIIQQANGRLAPQLLSFIGNAPKSMPTHKQLVLACEALQKPGESKLPLQSQALRRAADKGALFELKIITKFLTIEMINEAESDNYNRNALHLAAIRRKLDCARVLVKAGASTNIPDAKGHTALDYAILNSDEEMITLLSDVAASLVASV